MKTYLEFIQEDTATRRDRVEKQSKSENKDFAGYDKYWERLPVYEKLKTYLYKRDENGFPTKEMDEDVYVSFRSINKVGLNPHSDFKTPNGVYCYPLAQMIDKIERGDYEVYASNPKDSPFVYVLKATPQCSWDTKDNPDTKVLSYYFKNYERVTEKLSDYIFEKFKHYGQFHNLLSVMAFYYRTLNDWTNYRDAIHTVHNLYHPKYKNNVDLNSEDYDKFNFGDFDAFVSQRGYDREKAKKIFRNLMNRWFEHCITNNDYHAYQLVYAITLVVTWQMVDKNAEIKYKENYSTGAKEVVKIPNLPRNKWAYIMRDVLGFDLIVDKNNEKMIHELEPTQAVFLSSKAYEVLDSFDNKR